MLRLVEKGTLNQLGIMALTNSIYSIFQRKVKYIIFEYLLTTITKSYNYLIGLVTESPKKEVLGTTEILLIIFVPLAATSLVLVGVFFYLKRKNKNKYKQDYLTNESYGTHGQTYVDAQEMSDIKND